MLSSVLKATEVRIKRSADTIFMADSSYSCLSPLLIENAHIVQVRCNRSRGSTFETTKCWSVASCYSSRSIALSSNSFKEPLVVPCILSRPYMYYPDHSIFSLFPACCTFRASRSGAYCKGTTFDLPHFAIAYSRPFAHISGMLWRSASLTMDLHWLFSPSRSYYTVLWCINSCQGTG